MMNYFLMLFHFELLLISNKHFNSFYFSFDYFLYSSFIFYIQMISHLLTKYSCKTFFFFLLGMSCC